MSYQSAIDHLAAMAPELAIQTGQTRRKFSLDEIDPAFVEPERDFALTAAVQTLPPRRRLVVFLRYFADLEYRQIAHALEIETGTVSATLHAAHANLRTGQQEALA